MAKGGGIASVVKGAKGPRAKTKGEMDIRGSVRTLATNGPAVKSGYNLRSSSRGR